MPIDRMHQFEDDHLSDLDSQIQRILKMKKDDEEKSKLYVQALQKFVTFPHVNCVHPVSEIGDDVQNEKKSSENHSDIENELMQSVPVKHKGTAHRIIHFFKKNKISWNQSRELTASNNSIPGSDVIELVNFLLRYRTRKPHGFEEFKEILNMNNFPKDFIKNKNLTDVKTLYAKPTNKRKNISSSTWLKL